MAKMREIFHIKGNSNTTPYALMIRDGNTWLVFQGVWADDDAEAMRKGMELVGDIEMMMPQYKDSVFTVVKVLSTTVSEN